MIAENNLKCCRCGKAIKFGTECIQVDNMFFHKDCWEEVKRR